MIFPTIHLNGTGATALIDDYTEAAAKVRDAQKALANMEFHQRDYYVQDKDGSAWRQAREEHNSRLARLEAVYEELTSIAINLVDQQDERERNRARP